MFANNPDVAFGDINLSEQQIRGTHQPGAGGWPTIKYFNKETGVAGATYNKKTDLSVCDELGPGKDYMQQYVEEAGNTALCSVSTGKGCGKKERDFIDKWKSEPAAAAAKELDRLQRMKTGSMKPELKKWLGQRSAILKQLAHKKEEL
mmetsp:Transcript_27737/g.63895  ORF Transcript_27737/g.63895 Transcript_27737/m.63895 type:complete len:148 (+) Transcript_27737:259-702(+)